MTDVTGSPPALRPAAVCAALLAALDAADGRRRKRKRDQTPDAFGLAVKRDLLQRAVAEDPAPAAFEAWLLAYPQSCHAPELIGPAFAMARAVFEEWQLAHSLGEFRAWLEQGAPSDDANDGPARPTDGPSRSADGISRSTDGTSRSTDGTSS